MYHRGHRDIEEYRENTEEYSVIALCSLGCFSLILCVLCDTWLLISQTLSADRQAILFQYINAETISDFLKQLKTQYGDKPIKIVLDNARYQHCKIAEDQAKELGITLLFLPPYSPNLNIIERLW